MARPFFTIRYSRHALVLIAVLAISAVLDTVFWRHAIHSLETTAIQALTTAQENGWKVETTPLHRGGWPFGAWVEFDQMSATHKASHDTPYDAGWAGERIRLGGSWISLLRSELPLSLGGHQAARLVLDEGIVTLLAPSLEISFRNLQSLTFSAPQLSLSFSGKWPDRQIFTKSLSGRFIRFPGARADDTRLGITARATEINGFPLPYGVSTDLQDGRLAMALTAASSSSAGRSLLDLTSYKRLLLQEASASPASSSKDNRIALTGALTLPAQTGTLTLTVTRWHELATQLLDRPNLESRLAPDLREMLQKLLQRATVQPGEKEHPFSISIPVANGLILPDAPAISTLLSQKFQAP
ncbi:DUF2125 domain-containing protein [Gluconobacter sp. Dm-62]|uniref:DUF2125 domain-containing protein n=1 Tax=Gluconobacter sp. Dm-62 TaxID=2799804 RepID=UPI001B8C4654|nr:DUF2125 domain-containing protein [Gluconobacter sp. Dm-62]MBS1103941.1 DUF2125 domain-containing protein [Gluconobacter sp. Dm-62]